jgi:hypothetical protein
VVKTKITFKAFVLVLLLAGLLIPFMPASASESKALQTFPDFVSMVTNGQADVVQGVYVPGVLAYRVVTQPVDNPGYVSMSDGVVTQFGMATRYKVIALLAHNNLAGVSFTNLVVGQEIRIVYGDGRVAIYIVNQVARFQALQPFSENSDFLDLSSNSTYSTQTIFKMFYQGGDHVTFQTCILRDGNASWGRLFVTAVPALFAYNSETRTIDLNKGSR